MENIINSTIEISDDDEENDLFAQALENDLRNSTNKFDNFQSLEGAIETKQQVSADPQIEEVSDPNMFLIEPEIVQPRFVFKVIGFTDGLAYDIEQKATKFVFDSTLSTPENPAIILHEVQNDFENQYLSKHGQDLGTDNIIFKLRNVALLNTDYQFSLPSESPLIKYTLLIRRTKSSFCYEVLDVLKAEKRFASLSKSIIVDWCTRIWRTAVGQKRASKKQWFQILHDLPATDIQIRHLDCLKNSYPEFQLPLTRFVCIQHKPPSFFKLLSMFSSTLLCKFNTEQLEYIESLLESNPFYFCFRSVLVHILSFSDTPFAEDNSLWEVNINYATMMKKPEQGQQNEFFSFRERMLFESSTREQFMPTMFHPRFPLLLYSKAISVYNQLPQAQKNFPVQNWQFLKQSLELMLNFDSKRYNTGSSTLYVPELQHPEIRKILIDDLQAVIEVVPNSLEITLRSDCYVEMVLARFLHIFANDRIETFESEWYNIVYCYSLDQWFRSDVERFKGCRLFYTHSYTWKNYLNLVMKKQFEIPEKHTISISEIRQIDSQMLYIMEERKKLQQSNINNVLDDTEIITVTIEHVHKFSAERLLGLLWGIVNLTKRILCAKLKLILIGDSEDLPVCNLLGTGNIWKEICKVFPSTSLSTLKQNDKLLFPSGVSARIKSLQKRLLNRDLKSIQCLMYETYEKASKAMLAKKRELNNTRAVEKKRQQRLKNGDDRSDVEDELKMTCDMISNLKNPQGERHPKYANYLKMSKHNGNTQMSSAKPKIALSQKRTVRFACSGKQEQKSALPYLSESRKSFEENDTSILQHLVFVNRPLSILQTGSEGIVKVIWKMNEYGEWIKLEKSQNAELLCGEYNFQICPCTLSMRCSCKTQYSTINFTCYHNLIEIIKMFQGRPTDFILFLVSANTRRSHLLSAIKYCTRDCYLFMVEDPKTPFGSIFEDENLEDAPRTSHLATLMFKEYET